VYVKPFETPHVSAILTLNAQKYTAICAAIELLGYPTIYHMKYVQSSGHAARWAEALRAKFESQGKPYGREEFDDFLGEYGVCCSRISSVEALSHLLRRIGHLRHPSRSFRRGVHRRISFCEGSLVHPRRRRLGEINARHNRSSLGKPPACTCTGSLKPGIASPHEKAHVG